MAQETIPEWYARNRDRVFTINELMALVDHMGISSGATREEIDYLDAHYGSDPAYVWREPHYERTE